MTRLNWIEVAPAGARAMFGIHHYVTTGTNLPGELIQLVFLRVSQINGCAHCIDLHTRDLRKSVSAEKLALCRSGVKSAICSEIRSAPRSPGPRK